MKEDQYQILSKDILDDPEQREQVFHELREYFGEPMLPVTKYCKALETYANLKAEKDEEFAKYYRFLIIDIYKSCLLDRLIYCGEELRTEKCPKHDGHWSGINFGKDQCECLCSCGCTTGWLPNKKGNK